MSDQVQVRGTDPGTGGGPASSSFCSPRDFIDGVREMYAEWLEMMRRDDPSLKGLPDFEAAMNQVEQHGIGPCAGECAGFDPRNDIKRCAEILDQGITDVQAMANLVGTEDSAEALETMLHAHADHLQAASLLLLRTLARIDEAGENAGRGDQGDMLQELCAWQRQLLVEASADGKCDIEVVVYRDGSGESRVSRQGLRSIGIDFDPEYHIEWDSLDELRELLRTKPSFGDMW